MYVIVAAMVSAVNLFNKNDKTEWSVDSFVYNLKYDGIYWIADAVNWFNDIRANRK